MVHVGIGTLHVMNSYGQETDFLPPITSDSAPADAPPQLPPSPPQDSGPIGPSQQTSIAPELLGPDYSQNPVFYQALGDATPAPISPPVENAHMLGLALICTGLGAALGLRYGGLYGSVAGGLYGGATVNAVRAAIAVTKGTPDNDREATVSGTYAALGIGIASYLLWKTSKDHPKKSSKLHDDDDRLIGVK